jgi:hypothetical protein
MADFAQTAGSAPTLAHPSTFAPVAGIGFPVGTPVYTSSAGVAGKAAATLVGGAAFCTGLARSQGIVTERFLAQYADVLELTAAEWDAVAGTAGGLTPGAPYYLSDTPGQITGVSPVVKAPIGTAISATELLIQITFPLNA